MNMARMPRLDMPSGSVGHPIPQVIAGPVAAQGFQIPTTDPWANIEEELQPVFDKAQALLASIKVLPARIWQYCDPDFSGDDDMEEVQELFDCLGMFPLVGIGFDTFNATYSLLEGNWGEAGMRAVFIVPIVGNLTAAKIVVKSRKVTSISVGTLEEVTKSVSNTRLWRLPKHSDTVSVAKNVTHHRDGLLPLGNLRSELKRDAGIPKTEHHRWTVDHSISASLGGTNDLANLRLVTRDANQVKSEIEDVVVNFTNKYPNQVVDFVVDHGTKLKVPDRMVVKIFVNGRAPITATIPNVDGARAVSTLTIPGTLDSSSEAWRLGGDIGRVLTGSLSVEDGGSPGTAGSSSGGSSSTNTTGTREAATLSVQRGSYVIDHDAGCYADTGCRWVVGSGSAWPASEQFWITCGTFVDTSQNRPANYRARFVDANGNLSWGERICFSSFTHSVEVWTQSGFRMTATIPI